MDALGIIVVVIIVYFIFKPEKTEEVQTPSKADKIFDEYSSFFANECEKYGDEFLKSHDFKMIVDAVKDGDYHLLDYEDASELSHSDETTELSYSSEEIAECLRGYIKTTVELEKITDDDKYLKEQLILLYALSYLYKPKEEYKLRMRDTYVIKEFAKCIEKSARDSGDIKDASKLPFPREEILLSLIRAWRGEEDEKQREWLECGGIYLAYYQEGVGVEDLYTAGMDMDKYMKEIGMDMDKHMKEKGMDMEECMKKLEKFPKEWEGKAMLIAEKLHSDEVKEHRKKWEHFNKLCDKDIIIFRGMIVGKITTTHVGDTPIDDLIKDLPDDDKDSD